MWAATPPIAKAGQTLFTQGGGAGIGADFLGGGASILSVEQVLTRMSGPAAQTRFPAAAWPTETFNQPRKYMYLNGEGIEVFHQPAAHTDGDAIVFFRRSDVVVAGDVFDTTRFPVIDIAKGGSIQGEIAALQKLVDTAIPSVPIVSREEGTLIIPGHGRICDQLDVVEYRDMVTIIRDRIRDLMKQGLTLEQIKAASPARGYTRRYGSDTGAWTTNDFVEAMYRSHESESEMKKILIDMSASMTARFPKLKEIRAVTDRPASAFLHILQIAVTRRWSLPSSR